MNMRVALLVFLAMMLLISAAVAEEAKLDVPSRCGALQVVNGQLSNAAGEPVQLRGVSTHGLAWFPDYVNEECFRQLREEWGANVIRLAMYTAEYGGYCTDGDPRALKALIAKGVEAATRADMYVIIDWHILADNNPLQHMDEARDFFAEMSATYAGQDNVLYEICNEPNNGTPWGDVKRYAEKIIPVIRANDPDAIILVGTPNWCQYIGDAAADPIAGVENVMYTVHFYAASHKGELRDEMTRAVLGGLPVFVSEFGICDASGNGSIDEAEANRWVQTMDGLGVSYVMWNLSNKDESSAMLRKDSTRTSGFTAEDLSQAGRWLYATLTGVEQPDSGAGVAAAPAGMEITQADGLVCDVAVTNQWESNGAFRQYNMTIRNDSGADCAQWSVELKFDGAIELSDSWNGQYYVQDGVLRISSVSYNGSIPAGGTVSDVGFILKGNGNLIADAE